MLSAVIPQEEEVLQVRDHGATRVTADRCLRHANVASEISLTQPTPALHLAELHGAREKVVAGGQGARHTPIYAHEYGHRQLVRLRCGEIAP